MINRRSIWEYSNALLAFENLNEERANLINAQKLIIYVEEKIYVFLKWTINKTVWSFIELRRLESYDEYYRDYYW